MATKFPEILKIKYRIILVRSHSFEKKPEELCRIFLDTFVKMIAQLF